MIIRKLLVITGFICVIMGVIGIFIPGWPTTPFLLLSAGLFFYSSEKWYEWLLNHKVLGSFVKNYRDKRALPLKIKIGSFILMWLMISTSIFFFLNQQATKIIVITLGVVGSIVMLFLIPTLKEHEKSRE